MSILITAFSEPLKLSEPHSLQAKYRFNEPLVSLTKRVKFGRVYTASSGESDMSHRILAMDHRGDLQFHGLVRENLCWW